MGRSLADLTAVLNEQEAKKGVDMSSVKSAAATAGQFINNRLPVTKGHFNQTVRQLRTDDVINTEYINDVREVLDALIHHYNANGGNFNHPGYDTPEGLVERATQFLAMQEQLEVEATKEAKKQKKTEAVEMSEAIHNMVNFFTKKEKKKKVPFGEIGEAYLERHKKPATAKKHYTVRVEESTPKDSQGSVETPTGRSRGGFDA